MVESFSPKLRSSTLAVLLSLPGTDNDQWLDAERRIMIDELHYHHMTAVRSQIGSKKGSRKEIAEESARVRRSLEDEVAIYNVGQEMDVINISAGYGINPDHWYQVNNDVVYGIFREAMHNIADRIKSKNQKYVIIKSKATSPIPKLMTEDVRGFTHMAFTDGIIIKPDMMVYMVCDEDFICRNLKQRPIYNMSPLGLEPGDVLKWIDKDRTISDLVYMHLGLHKSSFSHMPVVSRHLSQTQLAKRMLFEDVKSAYTMFPITQIFKEPDTDGRRKKLIESIRDEIFWMNGFFCTYDPLAGDMGKDGEIIVGPVNRKKYDRNAHLRSVGCVTRDYDVVNRSDVIFGNYPVKALSVGQTMEMRSAHDGGRSVYLHLCKEMGPCQSPFFVYPPDGISFTLDQAQKQLIGHGFTPRFAGFMQRHRAEFMKSYEPTKKYYADANPVSQKTRAK